MSKDVLTFTEQEAISIPDTNFDKKTFVIVKNDGVDAQLGPGSIFHFSQNGNKISADYMGTKVVKGHLEGEIKNGMLHHHYEQYDKYMKKYTGNAKVKIIIKADGKMQLLDEWEWESQKGKGTCLMEEI